MPQKNTRFGARLGGKVCIIYRFSEYPSRNVCRFVVIIDHGLISDREIFHHNAHNIFPIEVKSSNNYTLTSLQKFIKKFTRQLATPIVVHYQDYMEKDGITYLPIYMVSLL